MKLRTPLLTALIYLPVLLGISPSQSPPPAWSFLEDADQDGMTDVNEILLGLDPLNPANGFSDLDGDGLSLAWEFTLGTNAALADTDADGWGDSVEVLTYNTDPLDWLSFPFSSASPSPSPPVAAPPPDPSQVVAAPAPPPPPPSLANGDFSNPTVTWKSGQSFKDYQGRGFDWGQGLVGGWTPYVGTTIEVWKAGSETFVELDGTATSFGIKQDIANLVPGHYVLTWKHCGRSNPKAEDNAYKVAVYYTAATGSAPVNISMPSRFKGLDKTKWTDNSHSFTITPAHIAAAKDGKITIALIPTGTLNTHGTLIDRVSLVPVEVVNKDEVPLSELKVAKMYPDVIKGKGLRGSPVSVNLDADEDRFFVRVKGADSLGTIKMKFETVDNPDPSYNDDPTEFTLESKDGSASTKSMVLVSDDVDDHHLATYSPPTLDNAPDDRTHKIQLGGNFKISAIKVGLADWVAADIKIPAKKKKSVRVQFVNCTYGILDLNPCWTSSQIDRVKKHLQERYAQVGIEFDFQPTVAGANVDSDGEMTNGEVPSFDGSVGKIFIPQETKDLIDHGPPNDFHNTLMIYLVGGFKRLAHAWVAG